jgi:uncharacterized SAM-binding protein YcdF (DUF218 family)
VETHISDARGQVALTDAAERITATAALARRFPAARILLSGGASHLVVSGAATESALARDILVAAGLPAERIELEEKSRDTCENAAESKLQAEPRPGDQWLLVTSASHMPRAVACFRVAGFPVIPYPVDYRTPAAVPISRGPRARSPSACRMPISRHMNGSACSPTASREPATCSRVPEPLSLTRIKAAARGPCRIRSAQERAWVSK